MPRCINHLALIVALGACAPDHPTGSAGPTVALIDSVVLQENDTIPLGQLFQGFAVDDAGRYYVASTALGSIVRFDTAGVADRVYGRRGTGPGEFADVFPLVAVHDSLVLGTSSRMRRLNIFRLADGEPLVSRPYDGYLASVAFDRRRVWLGHFSYADTAMVANVPLDSLLAPPASGTPWLFHSTLARVPAEFDRYPEIEMSPDVRVVEWNDSVLVGVAPLNDLWLYPPGRNRPDTLHPPAVRRRGVTPQALAQHFVHEGFEFGQALEAISFLEGLWRMSDGRTVLVHMDGRGRIVNGRAVGIAAVPFVTVLSADLRSACADASPGVGPDSRPLVTVTNDLLYVLEQVVEDTPQPAARTVVRRYRISDQDCDWRPVPRS